MHHNWQHWRPGPTLPAHLNAMCRTPVPVPVPGHPLTRAMRSTAGSACTAQQVGARERATTGQWWHQGEAHAIDPYSPASRSQIHHGPFSSSTRL